MDKRTRARELAMQCLYQLGVQGDGLIDRLTDFLIENEPDDAVRKMAKQWTKGTWDSPKKRETFLMS